MAQHADCLLSACADATSALSVVQAAMKEGSTVALRGGGCSYGDAALNGGGYVLETGSWNRILAFDEATGVISVEPGVTIEQLWRHVLPHGWWPCVVPGTMFATIGGCAAMNIHGKNNFRVGSFGEHIESFELLTPSGGILECTREQNADVFHAAIGGFGMLGIFTRITLRLHRVESGDLSVRAWRTRDVHHMLEVFEEREPEADYLVGWVDGFPSGAANGRGLIHEARYAPAAQGTSRTLTLEARHQELPHCFFGVIPRRWMWLGLWCLLNRPGMRLLNAAKYAGGRRHVDQGWYPQALVAFSFLLDYVPNWKFAYKPGGMIQYQSFVPRAEAARVFAAQLDLARARGLPPYLGVFKRHRPDPFLMTHALDGYSLALEFPVTRRNRRRVWAMAGDMDRLVTDAGGRLYFAKDSTMTPATLDRAYPADRLAEFRNLKQRLDPAGVLQSDLYKRLFVR